MGDNLMKLLLSPKKAIAYNACSQGVDLLVSNDFYSLDVVSAKNILDTQPLSHMIWALCHTIIDDHLSKAAPYLRKLAQDILVAAPLSPVSSSLVQAVVNNTNIEQERQALMTGTNLGLESLDNAFSVHIALMLTNPQQFPHNLSRAYDRIEDYFKGIQSPAADPVALDAFRAVIKAKIIEYFCT